MSEIKLVLGSHSYLVEEPIKVSLLAEYADTLAPTTEQNRSTQLGLSQFAYDFSNGIGVRKLDLNNPKHYKRSWDSEVETRFAGQVTPPLLVNTATGPEEEAAADTVTIRAMAEYKGALYGLARYVDDSEVNQDVKVFVFDPNHATTQWDLKSSVWTAPSGIPDDIITSMGDLKVHGAYIFASFITLDDSISTYTLGIYRSTDASSWTAKITGISAVAANDEVSQFLSFGTYLIVAMWDDSAGNIEVYSTVDNGDNWVAECTIPSQGAAIGLAAYVDESGAAAPWVRTREGWSIIDLTNNVYDMIVKTPGESSNLRGLIQWGGYLHSGRGAGQERCAYSGGVFIRESIGLNLDDGLPSEKQGEITAFCDSKERWLFVAYGGLAAGKKACVFAWDGTGWHYMFKHGTANQKINCIAVSSEDDAKTRLHISVETGTNTSTLYYLDYPLDNPRENSLMKFEDDKKILTPEFGGDQPEINGAAFRMDMEADSLGTAEGHNLIKSVYGVNGTAPATTHGTFTSADYDIDYGTGNIGVEFKRIQHEFELERTTGTNTDRPIMYKPVLHYRKKRNRRQQFEFAIDTSRQEGLNEEILSETVMGWLEIDIDTQTLLALKYGATDTDTYAVNTLVEFDDFVEVSSLLNLDNIPEGKRAGLVGVRVREVIK